jgi:tyrocidine synthetase-3
LSEWNGEGSVPIGSPLQNVRLYILDPYDNLQPVGVVGELYIAGPGLARGYLNNLELTSKKFFSSSLLRFSASQLLSFSLYRTGDLARWLPNGNIEFLGRLDHQVKIRGYRIELGEIENCLITHSEVKEAVVLTNDMEDKYLCAYIVPHSPYSPSLKEYLSRLLPDYMIPSYFVELEEIPLTPSGKIDRKALPAPEVQTGDYYAAPRDEIEKRLVKMWSEVLGVEAVIGIDDNFFALGGHSLKGTVLTVKIHKEFNVKLPLLQVFRTPHIRGMAEYIKEQLKQWKEDRYASIEPVEKKGYYPLSSAQKRLYILQQMTLESTAYNMPQFIPLSEEPDISKLEETFKRLIERHESLRTSFHMINNQPVQKVHDTVEFAIEYYDSQSVQPFDLSRAPLLRVGLVKTGENGTILSVDMHHIISDGLSHGVLVKDFIALYTGEDLPPLRIQYKDYAEWQNEEKEKETIKQQEAYWLRQFEEEVPVLNLPMDYERPKVQRFEGSVAHFEVNREITDTLKKLALEEGATLYMVLLAIYMVFLAKMSGQEDIVVGTPVAGRRHVDLEKVIGMFVNTLALRNKPAGEKTFEGFLREVKENALEAFENQEYPFEDLVENAAVTRDAGRNPLFDVMLVLQNMDLNMTDTPPPDTGEETSRGHVFENETAKFDLVLNGAERNEGLLFSLGYSTNLFKKETIERHIKYLHAILLAALNDRNIRISEIDILPEEERQQILYDFNDTKAEYPEDKTLHELFEEQAERTPDGVAIHMAHRTYMTYKQLNKMSNQLALLLKEKGVKPDIIAGIMMERSIEMVVGMLGILKAGGAYLPIDPGYPEERRTYMLKDSGARVLLTNLPEGHHSINCQLSIVNCQLLMINPATRNPKPATSSSNLAYVIYTSGSTGHPMGVMVEHRNAVNVVKWFGRTYKLQRDTHVLLMSEYTFDPSVNQVFGTLLHGAVLHIVDKELLVNVEGLRKYSEQHMPSRKILLKEVMHCTTNTAPRKPPSMPWWGDVHRRKSPWVNR